MRVIELQLPYPVSTNALYGNSAKGRCKTPAAIAFASEAAWLARIKCPAPITGPVSVLIVYAPKRGCGIDIDNVCKCCLDALTGIVWIDDSQVCRLVVERRGRVIGGPLFVKIIEEGPED